MAEQIAVLDQNGTILMVNQAWQRFGSENGNCDPVSFGVNYLDVCRRAAMYGDSAQQARRVLDGLRAVLTGELNHFEEEYPCHSPTERRWFVLTATPLTAGPGGAVVTHVNATARKLREQEILRQAHQDPLTGLANRRRVDAQGVQMLANARRSGRSAAVISIDLDGFKQVNDTFGHHVGDLVLREVAARLAAKTRASGLLARLGGDEFIALLPNVDAGDAQEAVASYLSALSSPLSIEGREIRLGGSIGLALYPEQGKTFAELLQAADAAMYRVKSANAGQRVHARESTRSGSRKPGGPGGERWPGRGRARRRGNRSGLWARLATLRR